MKIYLVGGALRDRFLGLPVKDKDWVVVGATSTEMLEQKYLQVGRDFPVFLHPQSKEEYALARTERKSGKGHTGFVVHASPDVTLEQDLARRDLTINAMAESIDGELVDPFNGKADLDARILRHVSPAFAEDPLRVLRVARFAARFAHLGFTVAPETLELMRAITHAGELQHLVAERVWQELHKALETQSPQVCMQVLRDCEALEVVLPELHSLFGVPQPAKYHPEIDTGVHSLMVLEMAASISNSTVVRFAALVHDVGKGATPKQSWPSHPGHEEAGAKLIEALSQRLKVPNEHRELAIMVSQHHTRCHRANGHEAHDLYMTLEVTDALRRPDRFELFLLACEADARGRLGLENNAYPQAGILQKAFKAAKQTDIQRLVAEHKNPQQLGPAIRQARIKAIAAVFP
ncbi:MAG: multifunctional CCA addition/repair protein [Pseudomonadota bacterium]